MSAASVAGTLAAAVMTFSPATPPASGTRAADLALVERCRRGDLDAFGELYQQHSRRLYNLSRRMVGSEVEAEDVLQDVFLQAYRKLDSFKGEASLGTWLYRLAVNLCLDRLRSRSARNERDTTFLDDRPTTIAVEGHGELTVTRLDLEDAIGELPESCRAAFLLHDVEGFEHREVGQILGIAEGTSKSQVHKARLRIREYLRGGAAHRAATRPGASS